MSGLFEQYFSNSAPALTRVVENNCSSQLAAYQQEFSSVHKDPQNLCQVVLSCILGSLDPTTLSVYQSANVLLGLTPTALSLLGNSTAEISLLSSGRPLLALLLAAGAPTISPISSFKDYNPLENLKTRTLQKRYPKLSPVAAAIVLVAEYLLAAASATNVLFLSYDLSQKAIFVPDCRTTAMPYFWLYIAVLIHLLGVWAFYRRVHTKRELHTSNILKAWLHSEMSLSSTRRGITYSLKPESYIYLFVSWLVSVAIVVQLVFGTLVLSSTTLIDTTDAVIIVLRYVASTIVCRIVLMFEVSGLQDAVQDGGITLASKDLDSRRAVTK